MTYKEKVNTLAQLAYLAHADNKISEVELGFIRTLAGKMNVSLEDLRKAVNNHREYKPPKDAFDRLIQFQQLILMSLIDKKLSSREIEYCRDFALKAGLNLRAVDEVIRQVQENGGIPLTAQEMLSIFSVYYN